MREHRERTLGASVLGAAAALLSLVWLAAMPPPALGAAPPTTDITTPVQAAPTTTTSPATPATTTPVPNLTSARATAIFLRNHKVAAWLRRYPPNPQTTAAYANGSWTVGVYYQPAGEIASGKVDDTRGVVTEAWTGPQVAWGMARGGTGFGGKKINSYSVWLTFCALFLLGLVDWRRPLSLRSLDLLFLLSFSASLWFFNRGHIFAAMPLVYPAFAWLIVRCLVIARRDRGSGGAVVWPTWVLLAATLCLVGYRIDLNLYHSNVIDVGLSGVIGADRIAHFQSPYGNFPVETGRPPCGPADASGDIRDHIQTNGRCEAADAQGDTYGPVAYEAYLPGYLLEGWSGLWDSLPAAHDTSILWDLIAIAGLWLVGVRFGGPKLGATLAFAWAAWPFTQYASSSNTNDLIEPALLVWAFYFVTSPFKRGAFTAFGAWTKLGALIVVPLWSAYPDARRLRPRMRFLWGFLAATALAFVILLFDPSLWHAVKAFYHDTFSYQFGRASPFSIWDWRQYHAKGIPDLRWGQRILYGLLIAGAVALAWWPRQRSPLRLAAFTGALLVGFEAVLTHWSWLYLPWFFPFVAFALLVPRAEGSLPIIADPWRAQLRALREGRTGRQLRLMGLGLAVAVFLGCWALLDHGFYAHPLVFDTGVYESYATAIRHHLVPYRDIAIEYPPGALPAFLLPTLLSTSYFTTFGWFMAACGAGCIVLGFLTNPSWFALPFLAVSPLLLGSLGPRHYDFWPTMFVVGALAAFVHDRHRVAWGALGAAFAIKLFAVVLVPLALVWTLRRRDRRELIRCLAVSAAVVAVAFVPFLVVAPHGLWSSLWGQVSRPLQIETLAGSVLETFAQPRIDGSHGSLNLAGAGALEAAFVVVLVLSLVGLWLAFARGAPEPGRLLRYAAACVCAFVIFGRVLSPQYLIWLVPLVPLVRGRRGLIATGLLGAALLATLVWFPDRYYSYVYQGHLAWLVLVRNILLLSLLAVLTLPRLGRAREPRPAGADLPAGAEMQVATLD